MPRRVNYKQYATHLVKPTKKKVSLNKRYEPLIKAIEAVKASKNRLIKADVANSEVDPATGLETIKDADDFVLWNNLVEKEMKKEKRLQEELEKNLKKLPLKAVMQHMGQPQYPTMKFK